MRKKNYLKLKKDRKLMRKKQKKLHDKLWANIKGITRDKDMIKLSNDFISMCDKTNTITSKLRDMGYYDNDLK